MTMNMRAQRGQTLPFVAFVLVVLVGIVGLATDIGSYRYDQRVQQAAADSAAIAGASELAFSNASAVAAAQASAASNGFTNKVNGVDVDVDPAYADSYTGMGTGVHVTITKSYPKYFGTVFGGGTVAVKTSAVALMAAGGMDCLYQLNASGNPNFSSMNFNAPQCGIIMNGTGNFNGATIDASTIGYSGSAPGETGATFTEATPAPAAPAIDPCPNIPGCNYLANNPPSTSNCVSQNYHNATVTLTPGCYGSMNFNNAHVTFDAGLYVVNGGWNVNGAVFTGTGVTFYGTSSGCVNFNGASLNFTPPVAPSNYAGVLIYQSPATPANQCYPNFNSATQTVSGVIYYPSVLVNFNGSLGNYTILVVGDVNFNGSTQNFPNPPNGGSYVTKATLAE